MIIRFHRLSPRRWNEWSDDAASDCRRLNSFQLLVYGKNMTSHFQQINQQIINTNSNRDDPRWMSPPSDDSRWCRRGSELLMSVFRPYPPGHYRIGCAKSYNTNQLHVHARTGHHHHLNMLGTDFFKFSVESTLTIWRNQFPIYTKSVSIYTVDCRFAATIEFYNLISQFYQTHQVLSHPIAIKQEKSITFHPFYIPFTRVSINYGMVY